LFCDNYEPVLGGIPKKVVDDVESGLHHIAMGSVEVVPPTQPTWEKLEVAKGTARKAVFAWCQNNCIGAQDVPE
jgi:ribose 1,5-bisphosphokinase PhnN